MRFREMVKRFMGIFLTAPTSSRRRKWEVQQKERGPLIILKIWFRTSRVKIIMTSFVFGNDSRRCEILSYYLRAFRFIYATKSSKMILDSNNFGNRILTIFGRLTVLGEFLPP